jgi:hypothetical protein
MNEAPNGLLDEEIWRQQCAIPRRPAIRRYKRSGRPAVKIFIALIDIFNGLDDLQRRRYCGAELTFGKAARRPMRGL